jgi:hypothetical protein
MLLSKVFYDKRSYRNKLLPKAKQLLSDEIALMPNILLREIINKKFYAIS